MRINKYIAECGIASRRAADALIEEGKVLINGKRATPGTDVSDSDTVTVNGEVIKRKEEYSYYLINKPKGYICSVKDDRDRKTVMSLLPEGAGRVYPVGRLDYDTEGLLILTDDGDLAFRLTHPKNEIPKTYLVRVEGTVTDSQLNRLRSGVELDGKLTNKAKVKAVETNKSYTKLHITVNEGRNRQVRRMFEAVGKEIVFLKRIKIGDMGIGSLERGKARKLSPDEVYYLKNI